ncbi:hypothetical protein BC941DRAFT_515653 [Chlamydoabsidia padenii]|nr:hypothetical protein BC941DRAFT_515653 [Chlamydoabsidia padenii]
MTSMASTQHTPLASKGPPSYYSIYMTGPPPIAVERPTQQLFLKQYIQRHCALLQRLLAAIFVAATISITIMLLLWQLQNLADPQLGHDEQTPLIPHLHVGPSGDVEQNN